MVAIYMNLMPSKVIERKACLRARSPFGLLKDLGPKGAQTLKGRRSQKK
jgi:hypothetical protein